MVAPRAIGDRDDARAGGTTLTLLGSPRILLILQSLAGGVKGQIDLRHDAGSPAQSTLRGHFQVLEVAGAMGKRGRDARHGGFEYELLESGEELLAVAGTLEHWLDGGPRGELDLGGDPARAAIKGLVDCWSSTMLNFLAVRPLSLTELDEAIGTVNYPAIERRLGALRLAGQIGLEPGSSGGRSYAITDWLRHGIGPLIAAAGWEHRNRQEGIATIAPLDVECAVSLIAPLLMATTVLPVASRLSINAQDDKRQRGATALVEVKDGRITYLAGDPQGMIDGWVTGSTAEWFSALVDGDVDDLDLGGDRSVAKAILDLVHQTLFGEAGRLEGFATDSQG